jgi:hypothetical protein
VDGIFLSVDVEEKNPHRRHNRANAGSDESGFEQADCRDHLSEDTVFTAPATPVAPVAMSLPESVVVLVFVVVPSGAVTVVSMVAHEVIPSAIVMMLMCRSFIFVFFDVSFSVKAGKKKDKTNYPMVETLDEKQPIMCRWYWSAAVRDLVEINRVCTLEEDKNRLEDAPHFTLAFAEQ